MIPILPDTKMCIYRIQHLESGKSYIGQTIYKVLDRWRQHCHPKSACRRLRNAIQKYGEAGFNLTVLEVCETMEQLNAREVHWIKELNTLSPHGYNLQAGGFNGIPSEDTRKKMSAWQIGRTIPLETRIRLSFANKNRILDPSAYARTALANTGRKHTVESIANMKYAKLKAQMARDLLNPPTKDSLLKRKWKNDRKMRKLSAPELIKEQQIQELVNLFLTSNKDLSKISDIHKTVKTV